MAGIISFLPSLTIFALSTSAISSALLLNDRSTLATFRRTNAILLTGYIIWLLSAASGIAYASLSCSTYAVTNAFLFGGFLCAGFEFLVIRGTFTKNSYFALVLAAIYPVSTLLILRLPELRAHFDPFSFLFSVAAFTVFGLFARLLNRYKTSLGFRATTLFQAFMKTWAGGTPSDLEAIIAQHSTTQELTSKVMRFKSQSGDIFIVLPGVHPGPFHPVGSYNLPGVITKAFAPLGPALALHRPGGHERNLVTNKDTLEYAVKLKEFARQIPVGAGRAAMSGPDSQAVGKATVGTAVFADDLLITITFSPLGSDDIDATIEGRLEKLAGEAGFDASIVDAHNALDHEQASPQVDEPSGSALFRKIGNAEARQFRVAYSHSSEVGFDHSGDITENGIGLIMFETEGTKHVLVLADANNAIPSLRESTARALEASKYSLMEFCTSDSHDLAARGLTVQRGYKALGEETTPDTIVKAIVEMAKQAEGRLSLCKYGSGKLTTKERVFGSKALGEFAAVTLSTSRLGREYLRFATISVLLLLLLSLIL